MRRFINRLFSTLTLIGLTATVHGAVVSENTAKTVGSNFLISKDVTGVNSAADLTLAYTATAVVNGVTINDYYVFNVNGQNAFVMVSGDDIIIPVLAFSNTSSFDISNLSPSTRDWIDGYKNQITAAVKNNVPAKVHTPAQWSDLETAPGIHSHHSVGAGSLGVITPLLSTTWDQDGGGGTPYNAYCPNTGASGGLSVTGCVATAMAQVMKFWNWPTVGCGSHTYYDGTGGSLSTNTFNYGNTAFNWSSMPLTSSNSSVATLMYAAGVSVNMSYTASESGSYVDLYETPWVNSAEYALQTYFHYKTSLKSVLRFGIQNGSLGTYYEGPDDEYYHGAVNIDSLTEAAWIAMLQTELNAHHPMLYEGQGSVGGHCWVCDGWETSGDMFHFNWGWSGASNGYYTVDNLAPPALGTGGGAGNFNYDQGVIMGIVPDSFPSDPGNIEMLAHLKTTTSTPMAYGTPFSFTTKIKNTGTSAFAGTLCMELFDTSSNMVTIIDSLTGISVAAGDSSAALTFSCTPWAVTPEIYNGLRIAYAPAGTGLWTPVANNGTFINYASVGVINDTDIVLYDSLHVGSHSIVTGSAISVTTTVGNQGSGTFSGSLKAILINTATGAAFTIQLHTGVSIASYASNSYTFSNSSVALTPGLYTLEIQQQYGSSGSFYTTSSDYYMNPILINITCVAVAGTITGGTSVCAGSSVALSDTASGGTWSITNAALATVGSTGVVSGLSPGADTIRYSVTNSCGTSVTSTVFNVVVLPTPASISGIDTVCIGQTITLSDATAGGAWNSAGSGIVSVGAAGAVTGLSTGSDVVQYTVTNACGAGLSTLPFYVSTNTFPSAGTINSSASSACLGTPITVTDTASGGVWSSATTGVATVSGIGIVTGVTAGTDSIVYSVTNTCGTVYTAKAVTFEQFPSAGSIAGSDTACIGGGSITLTDPVTGGTWMATNSNASISAGVVTGISAGTATVIYIVTNLCGSDTTQKTLTVIRCNTLANNVNEGAEVITLYPNPTQGSISISSTGIIKSVVISNLLGQEMFKGQYNTNETAISLNQFAAGVYLVRINDTKVYKIIKQ